MELEELKNKWQQLSIKVEHLEATNRRLAKELCTRRASGVQHRLSRSYRWMSLWGLVCVLLAPFLFYVIHLPFWMMIIYGLFGIIMGGVYMYFSIYINRCNYILLPMVEAVRHALHIRRLQRQILIFGIVCCLIVLVPFMTLVYRMDDHAAFYGACIGGVIGLGIGIYKEVRFFRMSRQLLAELRNFTEDSAAG